MDTDDIVVSVYCLTYNHAPYIRDALNGFINQKTKFKYEVIVHDDASIDNTATIIKEFAEKYPDIIIPIFQKSNKKSQGRNIVKDEILPYVRGKYVAVCEGDDFWIDENKLQLQVDVLEQHPDCHFSVHRVREIYADGSSTGIIIPSLDIKSNIISSTMLFKLFENSSFTFHLSSFFFRSSKWKEYIENQPLFKSKFKNIGDLPYIYYFGHIGNTFFLNKTLSCYRYNVPGGWTITMKDFLKTNYESFYSDRIDAYSKFDTFTNGNYHTFCTKRIAIERLKLHVMNSDCVFFFSKSGRKYFSLLSKKMKLFTVFAAVCPRYAKKIFINKPYYLRKRKSYSKFTLKNTSD